jgi:hypothetical protein
MASAVAGEGGRRVNEKESEPEQPNNAQIDRFANCALMNHLSPFLSKANFNATRRV